MSREMEKRWLHGVNREVSLLGLGTVKIGRNEQVKYPRAFDLPDDREVLALLECARVEGINLLDTAPAYGMSEERLGNLLGKWRDDFIIVSKAGEDFVGGESVFDFSRAGIQKSVEGSLRRLRTDRIEGILLHSDGRDLDILENSGAVEALIDCKESGKILAAGISTKTVAGGCKAIEMGLDMVMVTYNPWHRDEEAVLDLAAESGNCSVLIKKGFGSGWFGTADGEGQKDGEDPVTRALDFIFSHPASTAVVSGTINLSHLRENAAAARRIR